MRRREFVVLTAAAAALGRPMRAGAQQKPMPVIGWLTSVQTVDTSRSLAFEKGLSETGYVVGKTVAIDYRMAEGRYDRLPALAAELVACPVDVIVATGSPLPALAAKAATATISTVFALGTDPVRDGLIASLARPGGNLTGVGFLAAELMPKLLGLLTEAVPSAKVIALLVNPNNPNTVDLNASAREAARTKGVEPHVVTAGNETEIDAAFATLAQLHAGGLVVGADPFFFVRRAQIAALAARHAISAIFGNREFVTAGGLIGYGPSLNSVFHRIGLYVGKVLKGAKPADLPVEQPTRFELAINLKTAKQLGLTVPPILLSQADEVIE